MDRAFGLPLERGWPVRRLPSVRGGAHVGWWYSVRARRLVAYESAIERDALMMLDRDRQVVGLSSQPMRLCWRLLPGSGIYADQITHVPDVFVRYVSGAGVVLNCRRRAARSRQAEALLPATCAMAGWGYAVCVELDHVMASTLRWLADYRHSRYCSASLRQRVLNSCEQPRRLTELAAVDDPMRTLPAVYHLLFYGELQVDLRQPLSYASVVMRARS
ncbi:TnsA-like heteromeric transposase endonuclease subunit [Saccharopolyspora shandongensis]|uniref:TnsA-like heteromeric transposase endonuclease subunit n=1 Tax=Saccharopolyspora shandongensis TaxID=418495 RepID=UPI0034492CFB